MKRVVVTGATRGIGAAVAAACTGRGDRVVGLDLDGADLACDVADPNRVEAAARAACDELGGIDLVVHAAGVSVGGRTVMQSAVDARFVVDVNLLGTIHVVQSFGRLLVGQGEPSRLVLVGSEHSLGVPHLYSAVYTATKHAVLGYADVLRRELPEHVGVTVVCPGLVDTDLWRSDERRGASYGGPREADSRSGAVMARGMPAAEVADRLLAGVDAGEFLVVTHGHAVQFAAERWVTVRDAFARQAPNLDDRYALGRLVPRMAP